MKVAQIKEVDEGEEVELRCMVLKSKDGRRYKVFDRTGEIWVECKDKLVEGEAYKLWGIFKGGVVFVDRVERIENPKAEEFLPVSSTIEEDERRFWKVVDLIEDHKLKGFVRFIFEPLWESFKKGVAAKKYHHAYIGGLLQHTANVAEIVYNLAIYYNLRRDLAVAGALFHDLGKIWEFNLKPKFEHDPHYSKFGHIFLASYHIKSKSLEYGLPKDLANEIVHIILSHHGEYSKGSPVSPKTPEALLVHLVDNLDAQMNHMLVSKDEKDR